jgi:hypothetical protein
VYHPAQGLAPDLRWYRALQKGSDHQRRLVQRHSLDRHRIRNVEFDTDFMAQRTQFKVQALRQAVETVGQEEYAHPLQSIGACAVQQMRGS